MGQSLDHTGLKLFTRPKYCSQAARHKGRSEFGVQFQGVFRSMQDIKRKKIPDQVRH